MDNRMNDQQRSFSNQNRHHHGRHHRGGHRGGPRDSHGRSRNSRPLLTSATNAAGLALVAVYLSVQASGARVDSTTLFIRDDQKLLGVSVLAFIVSALISYFAQRSQANWIEKLSDTFFLGGLVLVSYVVLMQLGTV